MKQWTRIRLGVALAWTLGTALGTSGCASAPVIPFRGAPTDFAALVGEWDGTYASRDTGRHGSLWFKLIAGEDHAHGDVMMTPREGSTSYSRYPANTYTPPGPEDGPSRFLTIRFVRASDGEIDGLLDPYWDPDCRCEAVTVFRGRLVEGLLHGTFVTRHSGRVEVSGRWEATRRRTGHESVN